MGWKGHQNLRGAEWDGRATKSRGAEWDGRVTKTSEELSGMQGLQLFPLCT